MPDSFQLWGVSVTAPSTSEPVQSFWAPNVPSVATGNTLVPQVVGLRNSSPPPQFKLMLFALKSVTLRSPPTVKKTYSPSFVAPCQYPAATGAAVSPFVIRPGAGPTAR